MAGSSFNDKLQQKMASQQTRNLSYLDISNPGEYIFRLLQLPDNVEEPAFEQYLIHNNIYHPDFDRKIQVICLGMACPACKLHKEVEQSGDPEAWKYKATASFYWRIRDNKDGKIKLLKLSYTAQIALITEIQNYYRMGINLQDFKKGRDISLTVNKVNGKTHYKFSALTQAETKPILDKIIEEVKIWENFRPLKSLFKTYTIEELNKILNRESLKNNTQKPKEKVQSKGNLIDEMKKKISLSGINSTELPKTEEYDLNNNFEQDSDRVRQLRKKNQDV